MKMLEEIASLDYTDIEALQTRGVFDVIWQSFGAYGSPNYDENASRLPER